MILEQRKEVIFGYDCRRGHDSAYDSTHPGAAMSGGCNHDCDGDMWSFALIETRSDGAKVATSLLVRSDDLVGCRLRLREYDEKFGYSQRTGRPRAAGAMISLHVSLPDVGN